MLADYEHIARPVVYEMDRRVGYYTGVMGEERVSE